MDLIRQKYEFPELTSTTFDVSDKKVLFISGDWFPLIVSIYKSYVSISPSASNPSQLNSTVVVDD